MPPELRAHDHLWSILAKGKKKPPQACILYYWYKTTQQSLIIASSTNRLQGEWKRKRGKLDSKRDGYNQLQSMDPDSNKCQK